MGAMESEGEREGEEGKEGGAHGAADARIYRAWGGPKTGMGSGKFCGAPDSGAIVEGHGSCRAWGWELVVATGAAEAGGDEACSGEGHEGDGSR